MRRSQVAGAVVVLWSVVALPCAAIGLTLPPLSPALPAVPPSTAPPTAIGTLDAQHPVLGFSGTVQNPTPLPLVGSPAPLVCGPGCQEFSFVSGDATPLLVAIKNSVTGPDATFNPNDGFNLFVYGPSGTLVSAANGIGGNGQSISVSRPTAGGRYTVVVDYTYSEDPTAAYAGEVRRQASPSWTPDSCTTVALGSTTGCFLLPRLAAVPAYGLAVSGLPPVASTPLGFPFPVSVSTKNSCYLDEAIGLDSPSLGGIEHPITRCLRFTSDIEDTGPGALQVSLDWLRAGSGGVSSGFVPGECQAQQVLEAPDGTTATRPAGPCEFHPEHAHFHYKDLVSFSLYHAGSTGPAGTVVASSLKESFCLADDDYFGFGLRSPNGPRSFVGQPGCNVPAQAGTTGVSVSEGISPGWGDVYTWDTPDQFIDISSVAPGTYDLVEKTNPDGALLVAGPSETCAITELVLSATTVTTTATVPDAACPA